MGADTDRRSRDSGKSKSGQRGGHTHSYQPPTPTPTHKNTHTHVNTHPHTHTHKQVDAAARRKVEEELRAEMRLLEKERGLASEEALALRESLRSVAPEEQPQVIFQEVMAPWQQIRHKLDDTAAESLAAKMAAALRAMSPLPKEYAPIGV